MSKEKECPVCHKVGFHKMSCPTQKVTVFLSDVKVEGVTAESEGVSGKHEGATENLWKCIELNEEVLNQNKMSNG